MRITWRVHELAAQRRWGAPQLARKACLDEKTVRGILTGRAKRVGLETIERLCRALKVTPGSLWNVDPDPHDMWEKTAGIAGPLPREYFDAAMEGRWDVATDPGLERATRDL